MTSRSSKSSNFLIKQTQKDNPPVPPQEQEKHILEEIAEINILRQTMLHNTQNFDHELHQLENKLIKKANQLEILTSKQMNEISDKNLALVREFVNYQESFAKKLQEKNSNWDKFEMDLAETQNKLNEIMAENELVPKLALIEIMEGEVEQLIDEVEQLKKQKERRRL